MSNRRVSVGVDADVSPFVRGLGTASAATKTFARDLESADGRFAGLVQTGLALAPAMVPIGGAVVPALAGLTTQLGFAVAAAGVGVLAFQGVGDALGALNDYGIDPTDAHLEKLNETMAAIGPAGQDLVYGLQSIRPQMQELQDIAQAGMFPGVADGIRELLELGPQVESMIQTIAETMGDLTFEAGENLNDERWVDFFEYLDTEAGPTLRAMGRTLGNFFEGFTNMVMAFDPLSDMFTGGLLRWSREFVAWSDGLDSSESFQEFVDYIRENTPEAMATLGSLLDSLVELVEAAAPVGTVALPVIRAMADGFSAIADSPIGPVLVTAAAAVGTMGRSLALLRAVGLRGDGTSLFASVFATDKIRAGATAMRDVTRATEGLTVASRARAAAFATESRVVRDGFKQMGRLTAGAGALAVATTGVADGMGITNTATYGLMGALIGGAPGAAAGGLVGAFQDLRAASDQAAESTNDVWDAIAHGTRDDIAESVRRQVIALAELQEDRANFWSLTPEPGENYLQGMRSDLNAIIADEGEMRNALRAGQEAMKDTVGPADLMGNAIGKTGDTMKRTAKDTLDLSIQLQNLEGFFNRRSAVRAYEKSLDDLRAELRDGAKDWRASTKAGRENLDMLDSNATALLQVADNIVNPKRRKSFLEDARDDMVALTKTFPASSQAIGKVIRKLDRELDDFSKPRKPPKLDVDDKPAKKKISAAESRLQQWATKKAWSTPLDVDDKPAKKKIDSTDRLLANLVGDVRKVRIDGDPSGVRHAADETRRILAGIRDETVNIRAVRTGFGPQENAFGNFNSSVRRNAMGDIANQHQPELAGPGITRVWREPETAGESYIPHANDARRPRAKAILQMTAQKFGGSVRWNADGNIYRPPAYTRNNQGAETPRVSLAGLQVVGRVTVDVDGGDGTFRGVIREEIDADRQFDHTVRGR